MHDDQQGRWGGHMVPLTCPAWIPQLPPSWSDDICSSFDGLHLKSHRAKSTILTGNYQPFLNVYPSNSACHWSVKHFVDNYECLTQLNIKSKLPVKTASIRNYLYPLPGPVSTPYLFLMASVDRTARTSSPPLGYGWPSVSWVIRINSASMSCLAS